MILGWYFAIWGMSGAYFYTMGPFSSYELCQASRTQVLSVAQTGHVSPCWEGKT